MADLGALADVPLANDLTARVVAPLVNDVRNEGPEFIVPASADVPTAAMTSTSPLSSNARRVPSRTR